MGVLLLSARRYCRLRSSDLWGGMTDQAPPQLQFGVSVTPLGMAFLDLLESDGMVSPDRCPPPTHLSISHELKMFGHDGFEGWLEVSMTAK